MAKRDPEELEIVLQELKEASEALGLQINLQNTKILQPNIILVNIGNLTSDRVKKYVYLKHNSKLRKIN